MNVHQSLAVAEPIPALVPIAPEATEAEAMVRFERVAKTYPAYRDKPSVQALLDIDCAIRADRSPA
jgi:D-methionine transport system ATP-binding protein